MARAVWFILPNVTVGGTCCIALHPFTNRSVGAKQSRMITKPRLIALDADDTLWANQPHFDQAEADLKAFLTQYGTPTELDEALRQVQIENLPLLGYGAKGFTLSMIEVAIKLTGGQVTGTAIQ
ncbi:HAD family hydrolase [Rudanella paleaurantiibacter]|uniref:hypothetical protein n=1 Tax=Rudanella paleaurantiibacter TaxID=2614655 RepID=UPI001FEC084B|nr:hypothetical protein [Rudanella paleaurantiibacter]